MNDPLIIDSHTVVDARGKSVVLPKNPQRIVSLICSITETLFDLGIGGRVIGRTNYCIRPVVDVDRVQMIGGPKNPDLNLMTSLEPDLIIANIEENEKKDIDALEEKGIPVFVTYPRTVREGMELITVLGKITGTQGKAEELYKNTKEQFDRVKDKTEGLKKRPRCIYLIWRKPFMTINKDTFIHDLIDFAGGRNIYAEHKDRYPVITMQDIIEEQPDVIFLPSEPFRFQQKHAREFLKYDELPAVKKEKVLLVDGELFSWYGVRMIQGLPYVCDLFSDCAVRSL